MKKDETATTQTPTPTQKVTKPSFYPELTRMRDEVLARAYAEGLIKRPKQTLTTTTSSLTTTTTKEHQNGRNSNSNNTDPDPDTKGHKA